MRVLVRMCVGLKMDELDMFILEGRLKGSTIGLLR